MCIVAEENFANGVDGLFVEGSIRRVHIEHDGRISPSKSDGHGWEVLTSALLEVGILALWVSGAFNQEDRAHLS